MDEHVELALKLGDQITDAVILEITLRDLDSKVPNCRPPSCTEDTEEPVKQKQAMLKTLSEYSEQPPPSINQIVLHEHAESMISWIQSFREQGNIITRESYRRQASLEAKRLEIAQDVILQASKQRLKAAVSNLNLIKRIMPESGKNLNSIAGPHLDMICNQLRSLDTHHGTFREDLEGLRKSVDAATIQSRSISPPPSRPIKIDLREVHQVGSDITCKYLTECFKPFGDRLDYKIKLLNEKIFQYGMVQLERPLALLSYVTAVSQENQDVFSGQDDSAHECDDSDLIYTQVGAVGAVVD